MKIPPKPGDEVIWNGYHCYVRWVDGATAYLVEIDEHGNQGNTDERTANIAELELA